MNVSGVWGRLNEDFCTKSNNQCSLDELTWQMHRRRKGRTDVKNQFQHIWNCVQAKRTERKKYAVTNDWMWTNWMKNNFFL